MKSVFALIALCLMTTLRADGGSRILPFWGPNGQNLFDYEMALGARPALYRQPTRNLRLNDRFGFEPRPFFEEDLS